MIGSFLAECTIKLPKARASASKLYAAYREWCEVTGQRVDDMRRLSAELQARGFERRRVVQGYFYLGVGLVEESVENDSRR